MKYEGGWLLDLRQHSDAFYHKKKFSRKKEEISMYNRFSLRQITRIVEIKCNITWLFVIL